MIIMRDVIDNNFYISKNIYFTDSMGLWFTCPLEDWNNVKAMSVYLWLIYNSLGHNLGDFMRRE